MTPHMNRSELFRLVACAVLWTASLALIAGFVLTPEWPHGLGSLGVIIALAAGCVTVDLRFERHMHANRIRIQEILAVAEAEHTKQASLTRVH